MRLLFSIISLFCLCLSSLNAQFYSTGSDPWHRRWRQMEHDGILLVYDSLVEDQAKYLFPLIPNDYQSVSNNRLWNRRPFPVLLHSAVANSNGLVSWAPRRMELFSYADVESDCIPWLHHLAIHEGRHAWQTTLVENGQTSVLNVLFGQQATGLVLGLFVPRWLLEGDAVWQETDKSDGGRGRNADWLQQDIALALSGEMPSYEQSFFGSYRNFYPDFYHMGYLLSAYGRIKYGRKDEPDIWYQIFKECGRTPLSLNPFNRKLRQLTGLRQNAFYKEAMNYWHSLWNTSFSQPEHSFIASTPSEKGTPTSKNTFVSYSYPQLDNNGNTIAYRTSISDIPAFVRIDRNGNDIPVIYPAPRNESAFHVHGDTIIYSESIPHPRWENASKNVIRWTTFSDPDNIRSISPDWYHHYMSPSFSKDGHYITAIEQLPDGHRDIILMDINTQHISGRISFPIPYEPQNPVLLNDSTVAFILLSDEGKSVCSANFAEPSRLRRFSRPSHTNIRNLAPGPDNTLLYTSDESGSNQVYLINLINNTYTRLSILSLNALLIQPIHSLGASHPSYSQGLLSFASYTRNGYVPLSVPFPDNIPTRDSLSVDISILSPHPSELNIEPSAVNIGHPLAPHSWGPVSVDPSSTTISPALSAMYQNLFSTVTAQAAFNLDPNSIEKFSASLKYSAWYPILSLNYALQKERISILPRTFSAYINEATNDTIVWQYQADDTRRINRLSLSSSLPLQWVRGPWNGSFNIGTSLEYHRQTGYTLHATQYRIQNRYGVPTRLSFVNNPQLSTLNLSHSASVSILRRHSLRQVGSRYGIAFSTVYKHSPWNNTPSSPDRYLFACSASLYLPGIGLTHNIVTSLSYQKRTASERFLSNPEDEISVPSVSIFGNVLPSPRCLNRIESSRYTLLKTTYSLPVCDPDLSFSPVFHLKRLTGRLFFDHAWLTPLSLHATSAPTEGQRPLSLSHSSSSVSSVTQSSAGIELSAETFWLQLPYPIDLGVRYGIDLSSHKSQTELLLSVSFR